MQRWPPPAFSARGVPRHGGLGALGSPDRFEDDTGSGIRELAGWDSETYLLWIWQLGQLRWYVQTAMLNGPLTLMISRFDHGVELVLGAFARAQQLGRL